MKKNKKLTLKKRKCKIRQEQSRFKIELKRKNIIYSDRRLGSNLSDNLTYDSEGRITIDLPRDINLDKNYDDQRWLSFTEQLSLIYKCKVY